MTQSTTDHSTHSPGRKPPSSGRLEPSQLRRTCDPSDLDVSPPVERFVGQDRALSAVKLATEMAHKSYNLFVAAPRDIPVREIIKPYLDTAAEALPAVSDYAYVHNFEDASAPKLLTLPAGTGPRVAEAFDELIRDLREAIPAAFEKPEIQTRKRALENAFKERQETEFAALGQEAEDRNIAIMRGPMGFSLVPTQNDEVLQPADLKALDEAQQEERKATLSEFQKKLEAIVRSIPEWERQLRADLRKLRQETIEGAVTQSIAAAQKDLCDIDAACAHLETVKRDLIQNGEVFSAIANASADMPAPGFQGPDAQTPFERYSINVLVTHPETHRGVPVVEEPNPTLAHLVGRVEHLSEGGYLTTSFKLIKPGALHLANGGFLILDARNLLSEPMSWRALKRSLQSETIKTENLAEALNLSSTITLDPEPVPLSARIILLGDAWIYHVLSSHDPEFSSLFKLYADFEDSVARNIDTERLLAGTYKELAQTHDLLTPDTSALAYLIEDAARDIADANRLSVKTDRSLDLLQEAHHYAVLGSEKSITKAHVEKARHAQTYRASRIRDRMQEHLLRDIALVQTDGERVGQINGLSVYQLAGTAFGKPNRITARTRPGNGQIVDIERESRLGGPIHSKGVMVLSGFLAGRYVLQSPFSLHASIVLEQSYGGVEGDSASLAELAAILSAICGQPIHQSVAITGAVNQLGDVQAIGGANEKIEGFFDLCKARGLTGAQGVIIPASNAQHLMLRPDVVQACDAGQFFVHAVETLDEAIPVLFGISSDSLHQQVDAALLAYAAAIKGNQGANREPAAQIEQAPFALPEEVPDDEPPANPPKAPPKAHASKSHHNVE